MMRYLKSILSLIDENRDLKKRIDNLEKELEKNKALQVELVNYSKQVALTVGDIAIELVNLAAYVREINPDDADILLNSNVYDSLLNKKMFN